MKTEKYLKERGEKSLKPDDYRRIGRESVALLFYRGKAASYYTFRKTGQGVFVNGKVNLLRGEPKRKQMPAGNEGRGVFALSH